MRKLFSYQFVFSNLAIFLESSNKECDGKEFKFYLFLKIYLDEKSTRQRRCVLILLDQNAMQMVAHNLGFWHQHHSP
jgi:hypothetical protein